jgi:ribonuclease J
VDAGISFADDSLPGVDITIPDPYIFLNPSIKPKAMILTHAHEDHVGGLEYYFDKIDFPIYCNQFTFAYIKHKFKRISDFEKKFNIIKSYQEISFKNFSFQLIPTTHSIPARVVKIKFSLGIVPPLSGFLSSCKRQLCSGSCSSVSSQSNRNLVQFYS